MVQRTRDKSQPPPTNMSNSCVNNVFWKCFVGSPISWIINFLWQFSIWKCTVMSLRRASTNSTSIETQRSQVKLQPFPNKFQVISVWEERSVVIISNSCIIVLETSVRSHRPRFNGKESRVIHQQSSRIMDCCLPNVRLLVFRIYWRHLHHRNLMIILGTKRHARHQSDCTNG